MAKSVFGRDANLPEMLTPEENDKRERAFFFLKIWKHLKNTLNKNNRAIIAVPYGTEQQPTFSCQILLSTMYNTAFVFCTFTCVLII